MYTLTCVYAYIIGYGYMTFVVDFLLLSLLFVVCWMMVKAHTYVTYHIMYIVFDTSAGPRDLKHKTKYSRLYEQKQSTWLMIKLYSETS